VGTEQLQQRWDKQLVLTSYQSTTQNVSLNHYTCLSHFASELGNILAQQ